MDMEQHKPSKNPFLYGGALVAALIGSGFASGQEIMQFFAVYGTAGILAGCGLLLWPCSCLPGQCLQAAGIWETGT